MESHSEFVSVAASPSGCSVPDELTSQYPCPVAVEARPTNVGLVAPAGLGPNMVNVDARTSPPAIPRNCHSPEPLRREGADPLPDEVGIIV